MANSRQTQATQELSQPNRLMLMPFYVASIIQINLYFKLGN